MSEQVSVETITQEDIEASLNRELERAGWSKEQWIEAGRDCTLRRANHFYRGCGCGIDDYALRALWFMFSEFLVPPVSSSQENP